MIEVCKILFDLCFYYTLSGFYLYIFSEISPSGWGIPIIMLSAVVYTALKKWLPGINRPGISNSKAALPGTIICCALPGLLLALDLTIWQIIQFVPAWVFYAYTIWKGRIYTDRGEFESHFSFSGKVLATMILGFIAFNRVGGAISVAIPYLIVYLLSGVCLMRILREEKKLTAGRNIAVMLILLLGSIALAIAQTPHILLVAAGFLYRNVVVVILLGLAMAIGGVVYGIIWVIAKIVGLFGFGGRANEVQAELGEAAQDIFEEVSGGTFRGLPAWLEVAAMGLLALAVAFVVFMILRRLLGNKTENRKPRLYTEEQESIQKIDHQNKKSGRFRPTKPRQIVRWYYRKYLKEGVSRGLEPAPADTSLCISQKYSQSFPESEAEKLRDLYIRARYRYSKVIPKTDADMASEIWRVLKRR